MSKSPAPKNVERSAARLAAVQALYQMDVAATTLDDVIEQFVSDPIEDEAGQETTARQADHTFFSEILKGVVRRQRDIDPLVDHQLATGWRLVRVDSILRAILRAGSFELMERPDVPVRVIINEYIEVAHAFFEGDEPRVVNGVLDKIARKMRAGDFAPKNADG